MSDSAQGNQLPQHFCIIPWIHLNMNPNGDVFQCCISSTNGLVGNLKHESLHGIWNNQRMRSLRLQLLNGEKPTACQKCYEQEANGIPSFRQNINRQYSSAMPAVRESTDADGRVDKMTLRYWDFRFSNLCNMKCRMCVHDFSSAWHADLVKLWGSDVVDSHAVIHVANHSSDDIMAVLEEQIDLVEEIYFAGGEPLIMDEHYMILEKLIARGRRDVRLRYNTNLLKIRYRHWDNIELWKNFDSVHLHASIDDTGARAEYIRHGTVWSSIDENIKRLMSATGVLLFAAPTVQVLNILHIPDLVDYLLSQGLPMGRIRLNNVLTTPPHLHINTLDDGYKDLVRRSFDAHVIRQQDQGIAEDLRGQYDGIISYMDSSSARSADEMDKIKRKFKWNIVDIDGVRAEDFLSTFPELRDHFNRMTTGID